MLICKFYKPTLFQIFSQSKLFEGCTREKLHELLDLAKCGKSFFPYDYCTSIEKMLNCRSLPPIEEFYSVLKEESISQEQYEFAQKVWKSYQCKNLMDYAKVYCTIDTLLLCEIFEAFREKMHKFCGLDATHYISLPSLAWDAMLKVTKAEIHLPSDIDMVHMIEQGLRGGHSFINTRYLKGSQDRQSKNPSNHIFYIDANNLYGGAQCELLPYQKFRWVEKEIAETNECEKIETNGEHGYILEVDLEYPTHLHRKHNDFPLAPDNVIITNNDLSPFAKTHQFLNEGLNKYSASKLTSSFFPRKNYVVHLKTLQLYLKHGMKLTKVHRAIEFKQSNFLKKYIDLCTEKRKQAKSTFDKNFFKLMSNSCYGKTLQDPRKYCEIHLACTEKKASKLMTHPLYKMHKIINNSLVSVCVETPVIKHYKPYSIGFSVLDLSKHFMYEFYYEKLLPMFGYENINLGFSDTDSFSFKLFCTTGYEDAMKKLSPFMDFSNYPKEHKLFSEKNAKKLGYFKDEFEGKTVCSRFVGLRSKVYAMQLSEKDKLVCKGLGKSAIKNRLRFKQYKKCLLNSKDFRHSYAAIQSKNHKLSTVIRHKKSLSNFDTKRYIYSCGIHSSPYGSILITKNNGKCFRCRN